MTSSLDERTAVAPTTSSPVIAQRRRVAAGPGLASIGAIHIFDLPGKLAETPYLAAFYIALIIAAFVLTERLVVVGSRRDFIASAALSPSTTSRVS